MSCAISMELIDKVIDFHGHVCPGLMIGIRAAELALTRREPDGMSDLLAVCETDMCGVDAIQVLTGCTFGKGNLLHRDVGKMAFTFYDRTTGQGFRAILRPEAQGGMSQALSPLMAKVADGAATDEERAQCAALRRELQDRYMSLPLMEMFDVSEPPAPAPRGARVLKSLPCEDCGEMTMESRTRRFAGRTLCIPCFGKVEQKLVS